MTDDVVSAARAPPIVTTPSLASAAALRLVNRVIDQAVSQGWQVAVTVVDHQGLTLAAARMDGVTPPILDFANDKAFTAATIRRTTQGFAERMDSSPSLRLGLSTRTRLLAWGVAFR